jgi:hypothetical protein
MITCFCVYYACLFYLPESNTIFWVRLAKFLNLKKEASSFAGRVVELVLQLLNENAPVAVWSKNFIEWPVCLCSTNHEELNCVCFSQFEAIDLPRTVIKFYPSSVNQQYSNVYPILMFNPFSTLCKCIAHFPCIKRGKRK